MEAHAIHRQGPGLLYDHKRKVLVRENCGPICARVSVARLGTDVFFRKGRQKRMQTKARTAKVKGQPLAPRFYTNSHRPSVR